MQDWFIYLLQQGSKQLPARASLEIFLVYISTSDLNTGIEKTPAKHKIHKDSEVIC